MAFRQWYAAQAQRWGLDPNPDDPRHFYDYRAAFRAGAAPDASGHWPSTFKREGHPQLVVDGIDTRTGQPVMPRKVPPRTVKGQDIELLASDGQRFKQGPPPPDPAEERERQIREGAKKVGIPDWILRMRRRSSLGSLGR